METLRRGFFMQIAPGIFEFGRLGPDLRACLLFFFNFSCIEFQKVRYFFKFQAILAPPDPLDTIWDLLGLPLTFLHP